jgi:branched-chain amino acid transport system substrate-binding protein
MSYLRKAVVGLALSVALSSGSSLAGVIKVGVVGPFSGQFAQGGENFKQAIEVYQAIHGKTVKGDTIEFIYKDLPQVNPAQSRALSQELIVKDKVSFLAGYFLTPNALAVAPLIDEANIPAVIFNAATSIITEKSPRYVRTSFTLWQVTAPLADYVAKQGVKSVITAVTDYGPGIDAEAAFKTVYEKAGGKIVDTIRMPLSTNDFAPFMQRIKDSKAEALYAFLPVPITTTFVKAFQDNGLKETGIKFYGPGDLTQEPDLPSMGDTAIGLLTAFHYSQANPSALNQQFLAKHRELFGSSDKVTFFSVGAYDGVHAIYKMIEAAGGKDGLKAVNAIKGLSWESPRGPVTIDPVSRHVTQNVYLRVTEKKDGKLQNTQFETLPNQPDWGYPGVLK